MFGGAYERIGQAELYRVLKAYSVLNPTDGYCQAMAPIAALLLMSMPAEQAFWVMVMVCDKYIPGYYSPGEKHKVTLELVRTVVYLAEGDDPML